MMRLLYTLVLYAALPLLLLRLRQRARRAPAYGRRWRERFGFIPPLPAAQVVWVHAVSVGEALAAIPMIKLLREQYPQLVFMVTTTTPTGSERVRAAFGDSVHHAYMPYDLPDAVGRFLHRVKPCLLIVMETELWPNTLAACWRRQIPVILANARLSAKSARGYRRFGLLTRPMLQRLSVVAAQHRDDAQRFTALGLPESACEVTGSIKFDLQLSDAQRDAAAQLKRQWSDAGRRPVLLAASTHAGEDEIVLQAFAEVRQQLEQPLLVVVPRHPERFDAVFALCRGKGYRVQRRSEAENREGDIDIVVGDTMGELPLFFGACDSAFVGGSLIEHGGHNLIEPAAWGVPILSGPSLFNFTEVSRLLLEANALTIVRDHHELAQELVDLHQNAARRQGQGLAAKSVADANRGALQKLIDIVGRFL
ncbi:3-deoxy-D-manno-octulosonic acid transferase [Exilibacterium tricleocarpae]|uniref:3-deoxy-D-manno-octulosonic acid transferase n=1 Tax=Exilibacterium tricleocarpae TaxID=2591008 RepID=A0A545TK96_9GAMM|nr:lipid IV(A) 3-deoxy-D-manno-octulosonic acid transferase [Exilibacterium tricleocarpae]TQV77652.1 3-deoxy-D-manno-octulosonic acid transferase [Exilibacterium tricleocarpae]